MSAFDYSNLVYDIKMRNDEEIELEYPWPLISDDYINSMIIGNWFKKNAADIDEETKDWSEDKCAEFTRLVSDIMNLINERICYNIRSTYGSEYVESIARSLLIKIKISGFNKIGYHGCDNYVRGFIAGKILGFPTESNVNKIRIIEQLWWKSRR